MKKLCDRLILTKILISILIIFIGIGALELRAFAEDKPVETPTSDIEDIQESSPTPEPTPETTPEPSDDMDGIDENINSDEENSENSRSENLICLDLNVILDGNYIYSFSSGLNADVYINDQLVGTNVNDFVDYYVDGTKYKFILHPDTTKYRCIETEYQGVLTSENGNRKPIDVVLYSIGEKKLTVTGDEGIESIQGNGNYAIGSYATVTYTVQPGYHITKVTGDYYVESTVQGEGGLLATDGEWANLAGRTGTVSETYQVLAYDRTLQIHTEPNKCTITIDPNGGTYKGNSDRTSEEVANGTVYELNEIPTRPGYTFQGWKLSGGGTIKSGTALEIAYTNSTSKTDNDGTTYTNYTLTYKNDSNGYVWPFFELLTYSYELNHTYQVEFDIRVNTVPTGFDHTHIRHGAFHNNFYSPKIDIGNIVSAWNHKTMTRAFNSTTEIDNDGNPQTVSPAIEFFSQLSAGNTGVFDFDVKNVTVYDVTAQKYVTSNDSNVKAGTTVEIIDTDATVTAVWTPNTYTVHYDITDSETTIPDQTFIFDNPNGDTISTIKPVRKGYTFAGWRYDDTEDSSFSKLFNPGDKIPSGYGDFTLHATWEPITYTNTIWHWAVGFKNKEGNNEDKTARLLRTTTFKKNYGEKLTYTTADAIALPNGFSLSGIVGSPSYEGSLKHYSMGTSFTQPAKSTSAEYDYYPITYNITYNLDGGKIATANPSTYNVLYGVDFANEPVRSGYKFLGWYIGGKMVTGINVGCNATFTSADDLYAKLATRTIGNQTVEAKWEKLTDITITNTVSGNMGNKSKDFTYTFQLPSSFNGTKLTVVDGNGNTSTVTIGSDCKLSFTLKHGQSYTIKELDEAQFNSIKGLTNYGISETIYAEEGYKTSSTAKMDAHGNIQLIFNNQNGSVLPTGIILAGSGMGIIVALVIALGRLIKHKFIK